MCYGKYDYVNSRIVEQDGKPRKEELNLNKNMILVAMYYGNCEMNVDSKVV